MLVLTFTVKLLSVSTSRVECFGCLSFDTIIYEHHWWPPQSIWGYNVMFFWWADNSAIAFVIHQNLLWHSPTPSSTTMTTIRHDDKVYYADVSVPGVERNHGQGCCQRDLHTHTHTWQKLANERVFVFAKQVLRGKLCWSELTCVRGYYCSVLHGGKGFNSAREAEPNSTLQHPWCYY
jgi:hypothetical protein